MKGEYAALSYIQLQPQTAYTHPPEPPRYVYLDSPALDVMTDFNVVYPVTVKAEVSIDDALEYMKTSGVRLLLVTDETELIVGLITAKDIQGEKPVKVAEASRISRAQITVGMIMTSQQDVMAFNVISVRNAQVGHIVETLNQLERQHMLVVEVDQVAKRQVLLGLFSTSQINKQLHRDVARHQGAANSLAEMVHEIS